MISAAEKKLIRNLKQKKFRDTEKLFVVEGVKMVQEALDSSFMVHKLFVYKEGLFPSATQTHLITEQQMSEITHLTTPSPALALVEMRNLDVTLAIEGIDRSCLYLGIDSIRDPGNFGTMIRIAAWFGIKAIFASPDTVELYNPKVVHASMGALFSVPVYYVDLCKIIDALHIPIWGSALDGENLYQASLSKNGMIIIGNESTGISTALQKKIDRFLLIPPYPQNGNNAESLNAAVATAIICAEFRRRADVRF